MGTPFKDKSRHREYELKRSEARAREERRQRAELQRQVNEENKLRALIAHSDEVATISGR